MGYSEDKMKKEDITDKNFNIITLKEEQKLSLEEKSIYYENLRKYILKRKLTNTTIGATTIAPKCKKFATKIASSLVKVFSNKNAAWVCEGQSNIPAGAVIFAHTHQGVLDNFVWMPEVEKHCLILHGQGVSKLLLLSQTIDGLILVKKGDKKNNNNAKLDMIKVLLEGHSVTYFPESTWNLSPNKLHLPLSFGVIDTAKKAKVPIVPVVHEFTYDTSTEKEDVTKIHSKFGKPIYVDANDDLLEKLHEYEESISTMRYEMIEAKGLFKRSELTNFDYINYLKGNYKNIKFAGLDINDERKYIYTADSEFYQFHHVNDVPWDEWGVLKQTDEIERLKRINRVHKI